MITILIHGSGQKAQSWMKTISYMKNSDNILCPELSSLLDGKEVNYENLYSSFTEYCTKIEGQIHFCGISLGGILALNFALDFPDKVKTLVLIGTPHKVPKIMLAVQNTIFKFLPTSFFENAAFNKKDTFALGNSMKNIDFTGKLQSIKCPTMIICGKKDSSNIKSSYYFHENIINSKLEILNDTGHVVNEENPKLLAKILDEYYIAHKNNDFNNSI